MNDWKPKPGDVAMSHDEFVAYTDDHVWIWATTGAVCLDQPPSMLRRIALVDPEDREVVAKFADLIDTCSADSHCDPQECMSMSCWVDRIAKALREFAAPKPPRPDEPQGLGAVVEDAEGALWVRVGVTIGNLHWRSTEPGNTNCFKWQAIDVVRVLSEGVRP